MSISHEDDPMPGASRTTAEAPPERPLHIAAGRADASAEHDTPHASLLALLPRLRNLHCKFVFQGGSVYANGLAIDIERLLDEYRAACRVANPEPPTFMGEPVVRDAARKEQQP